MKKVSLLLLLTLTAMTVFAACGKKEEKPAVSEIENLYETIPVEETTMEEGTEETVYSDDENPPEEGYVRSSLTNQWVPEEVANTRPIAVMMPTDSEAQPQYNIGNAGVLYECMEEGGISRQMAIIEGWADMEKIGNIRSCREYYLYMGSEWDSIIVHFGGVVFMKDLLSRPDVNNISGAGDYGADSKNAPGSQYFFRSQDKAAPHNAYISGENLTKAVESLKYDREHRSKYWDPNHFSFTSASSPNTLEDAKDAKSATKIDLSDVFPVTKSYLEYDEDEGVYYKWLHKAKQVDAATGNQLSFDNVIIQITDWANISGEYKAFDMLDVGKKGYYCTKGKVIPITWTKTELYQPTKYYDMDGNEIVLNTGKTYIAVAQEGKKPKFE